jgi:hypothetical protein
MRPKKRASAEGATEEPGFTKIKSHSEDRPAPLRTSKRRYGLYLRTSAFICGLSLFAVHSCQFVVFFAFFVLFCGYSSLSSFLS